jgi:hypothetical protein
MVDIGKLQETIQKITVSENQGIPVYIVSLLEQVDLAINQLVSRISVERSRANLIQEASEALFSSILDGVGELTEAEIDDCK